MWNYSIAAAVRVCEGCASILQILCNPRIITQTVQEAIFITKPYDYLNSGIIFLWLSWWLSSYDVKMININNHHDHDYHVMIILCILSYNDDDDNHPQAGAGGSSCEKQWWDEHGLSESQDCTEERLLVRHRHRKHCHCQHRDYCGQVQNKPADDKEGDHKTFFTQVIKDDHEDPSNLFLVVCLTKSQWDIRLDSWLTWCSICLNQPLDSSDLYFIEDSLKNLWRKSVSRPPWC